MEIQRITIIGQGNVATHYYNIMKEKNLTVKMLSSRLPFQKEDFFVDLVVIAVKDDAIESICQRLSQEIFSKSEPKEKNIFQDSILVHTSGFLSTDCLKKVGLNYGSFYPLQSLKKDVEIKFEYVPLCTWANNEKSSVKLDNLANKLSKIHYNLDDTQRKSLHVAAVFVNNFPNHLFGIAKSILDKANIPFTTMFPLMDRTVEAAKKNNPFDIQTGPAIRKDNSTMQKHKERLSDKERKIYEIISEDIINKHDNI